MLKKSTIPVQGYLSLFNFLMFTNFSFFLSDINIFHSIDKMFSLSEIIREGSLQTGNKEEFFLMMPVPDTHFSKMMQGFVI